MSANLALSVCTDPDMLEVGNGGLTVDEEEAHFSLCTSPHACTVCAHTTQPQYRFPTSVLGCLVKAPLMIGCDVSTASNASLAILLNREAIAVSQDPLGVQGRRLHSQHKTEVWAGPLSDGSAAVVLLNVGRSAANITVTWHELGFPADMTATVRDLNQHTTLGNNIVSSFTATVRPHSCVFIRVQSTTSPVTYW